MSDRKAFITTHLRLKPAPAVPEITLYTAHPGSGLSRLGDVPPYWAYHWAGGTVLARYILDHPEAVAGRRVVDLGSGSGVVAIAALKAGAGEVQAVDVDGYATAAAELNAAVNAVALIATCRDILDIPPPDADLILVGDLFYNMDTAQRVTAFLDCCAGAGMTALVGDPGRVGLPLDRMECLAEYQVPDFATGPVPARVYAWLSAGT